ADEKELKRRRYYDEHIKKYAKPNPVEQTVEKENKSTYNEFKYILFATPLAALLFLLIMKLASPGDKALAAENAAPAKNNEVVTLSNGASPYSGYFGEAVYSKANNLGLRIKNQSGNDVIVCLFSADKFIRSFFLEADNSAEVPQLPTEAMQLRYCSGRVFKSNAVSQNGQQLGAFTQQAKYYLSNGFVELNTSQELTLLPDINEGFNTVNETQFFKKVN
ncbi:MAG: hypothetical protein IT236_05945, partial [Bacteroidia bacterium]|nr:hypothetical protein [Bacteroidia bacterium]